MGRIELEGLPACEPNGRHWFWHGEQILALLDMYRPVECVELGSYKGGSAIATARAMRGWGGRVTCIDAWDGSVSMEECAANLVAAGVQGIVSLIQGRTDEIVKRWDVPIDYLYVDADHSYEGCKSDLELWWLHLRVSGLIAGDDYDDPRWGVTQAWDEFEREHGQAFVRRATPGTDPACARLIWGVKQ